MDSRMFNILFNEIYLSINYAFIFHFCQNIRRINDLILLFYLLFFFFFALYYSVGKKNQAEFIFSFVHKLVEITKRRRRRRRWKGRESMNTSNINKYNSFDENEKNNVSLNSSSSDDLRVKKRNNNFRLKFGLGLTL